jgi:hypothetical protein
MPPAIAQVREYLNEQFSGDLGTDFHTRCGCHIIDRAVKDSAVHMRAQLQKLRDLLKGIRLSSTIRQKIKNTQVCLGRVHLRDVPGLDVDTRWGSSFAMIKSSFELKDVLEAICNVFWLAVLYSVVRLTLADSKAVLLAYYASLRLFSCSYFTYILRSAVAQPNLLARRSLPLMSGLPRRRRGCG